MPPLPLPPTQGSGWPYKGEQEVDHRSVLIFQVPWVLPDNFLLRGWHHQTELGGPSLGEARLAPRVLECAEWETSFPRGNSLAAREAEGWCCGPLGESLRATLCPPCTPPGPKWPAWGLQCSLPSQALQRPQGQRRAGGAGVGFCFLPDKAAASRDSCHPRPGLLQQLPFSPAVCQTDFARATLLRYVIPRVPHAPPSSRHSGDPHPPSWPTPQASNSQTGGFIFSSRERHTQV